MRFRGFAIASILSIALGIGANTAVFSLLDALVLRPMPVRDPGRLVVIGSLRNDGSIAAVPTGMLKRLQAEWQLDGVCGIQTPLSTVEVNGAARPLSALALTGDCFRTLGVLPAAGRLFTQADDIPNGTKTAVLSYAFWKRDFGGDPSIAGRSINIEGTPYTIAGVTEERFTGVLLGYPALISYPMSQQGGLAAGVPFVTAAFARLKPGVSAEQLKARLETQWVRWIEETLPAQYKGAQRAQWLKDPVTVQSAATGLDYTLRKRYTQPLYGLFAISILVLAMACVNVANLQLARGLERRREIAVRMALGGSRAQIALGLIRQNAWIVAAGAALGVGFSYVGDRLLLLLMSRYNPLELQLVPDWRVLAVISTAAFAGLLLFGILPAWQTSDSRSSSILRAEGRSIRSAKGNVRRLLIVVQVALSLVLVSAGGLFFETLRHLYSQPLGIDTMSVLSTQLLATPGGYGKNFSPAAYYRGLLESARRIPGVESASLAHFSPLLTRPFPREVKAADSAGAPVSVPTEYVTDGFLKTMGIPLQTGHDFSGPNTSGTGRTAIISASLAKRLFGTESALGKRLRAGGSDLEIIGIAAPARVQDPRSADTAFVYLNGWEQPENLKWPNLQVRYSGDAALAEAPLREVLRVAGHEYPLFMRTIAAQRDGAFVQEQMLSAIGGTFAALALALSAIGLFGLLSFFVANREGEIGIRYALGARTGHVAGLVLREAFVLFGIGITIGVPVSWAAAQALSRLFYGVGAFPGVPLFFAVAALAVVTAAAAVIPLRRATATDPIRALRY